MISERYLREFCCGDPKDIENYEEAIADKTRKWVIHHRKELTEDGKFAYYAKDLIKMGEYYKRPAEELIFLTRAEHNSLHHKGKKGKPYKHHDITVSQLDDRKAYKRAWDIKNKEKNIAKRRERYLKKKALTSNK